MVIEYGYEYDAMLDEALWKETEGKVTNECINGAIALRSGRDALKAVAREYQPTVALIPALACDSMVRPFLQFGHKVEFYKLNKDYSIDLDSLYSLIPDNGEQCLFLYMDYFGNKAITDENLEKLRSRDLIFIYDRTHNYINSDPSTFCPDYTAVSLRKWLSIPDGGLLWGTIRNTEFSSDTLFSATRLKAQCMRHEFLNCGDEDIKREYRKIFSTVSDIIDHDPLPGRMSAYAAGLLTDEAWETCKRRRRDNSKVLTEIFKTAGVRLIQNESELSDLYVPIIVENRGVLQNKLSAMGIFTTLIWPISPEQGEACEIAKYTEEHMLGVPCDQRYSRDDAVYIGNTIVAKIRELGETG